LHARAWSLSGPLPAAPGAERAVLRDEHAAARLVSAPALQLPHDDLIGDGIGPGSARPQRKAT
jgi:hypothetical protein